MTVLKTKHACGNWHLFALMNPCRASCNYSNFPASSHHIRRFLHICLLAGVTPNLLLLLAVFTKHDLCTAGMQLGIRLHISHLNQCFAIRKPIIEDTESRGYGWCWHVPVSHSFDCFYSTCTLEFQLLCDGGHHCFLTGVLLQASHGPSGFIQTHFFMNFYM